MICALIIATGILSGLFNRKTVSNALTASGYYKNLIQETRSDVDSILVTSGLDKDIAEDVITRKELYKTAQEYVSGSLKGETRTVDVSGAMDRLQEKIENYLIQKEIESDKAVRRGVNLMMQEVESTCRNNMENPMFRYLYQYGIRYRPLLYGIIFALIILLLLLHVILVKQHRLAHRGWNYLAYSWLSGSMLAMVLPVYGLITGIYKRINVSPDYFNRFLSEYLKESLQSWFVIALIGVGIYFVILVCVIHRRRKLKAQQESKSVR